MNNNNQILIVYFSSSTKNTKRFVEKLGFENARIPLNRKDGELEVHKPYILVTPTYGGGEIRHAVPKQVIKFLNNPKNRENILGVITSGNTNFGKGYCLAGKIISQKCAIPNLYNFELLGTAEDVNKCREGIIKFYENM